MILIADKLKLDSDPIALLLIKAIQDLNISEGNIYYNFPFYRGESVDELVKAHVLFISKEYGVIFFRCVSTKEEFTEEEKKKLDTVDSHIFSKINKHEEFRLKRRDLKINVTPYIFIDSSNEITDEETITISILKKCIESNKKETLSDNEFLLLQSVIEGTVYLRKKKDREVQESKLTKGKILSLIQSSHAGFDIDQKRAALNTIDSPQRIRGLAGSGKTIILTMKAALYHLANPEAEILYTYFTKSLNGQVKYLIEKYYRDFSDNREPNWNKIHILHGWGGKGLKGVYSDTCFENQILPISFLDAKGYDSKDPFNYICKIAEQQTLKQKYELCLIDEGQDFPVYFYRLCRKITKSNRIVWAYDDFQNIFDVNIQDEKETFGTDKEGVYYVDFSRKENELQDIALQTCYRTPRIALINAFSLGLGIYNNKVLQRLENNKHWEDLGFKIEKGDSSHNSDMVISRPSENSPVDTNRYFQEESVQVKIFENITEECNYISNEIIKDITEENLRPDDICVISLDSRAIKLYFEKIEENLTEKGINVFNLLNVPNNNTRFNVDNHVTLATLNKAKGNETGMVYIIGTDAIFRHKDYIVDRNKLFTAMTRSKGWMQITGFKEASICQKEMDKLKENDYKLKFIQPSKDETKTILRGMTEQQSTLNAINKEIDLFSSKMGLSKEEVIKMLSKPHK